MHADNMCTLARLSRLGSFMSSCSSLSLSETADWNEVKQLFSVFKVGAATADAGGALTAATAVAGQQVTTRRPD
jgi:hypothetical protein